jgi:hypothetical protein
MFRSSNIGGKVIGRVINLQEILIDLKHNVEAFELGTVFGTIKVRDSENEKRSVAFRLVGVHRNDLWQSKTKVSKRVQDDKAKSIDCCTYNTVLVVPSGCGMLDAYINRK